jgi:hypothetical protein
MYTGRLVLLTPRDPSEKVDCERGRGLEEVWSLVRTVRVIRLNCSLDSGELAVCRPIP